MDLDLDDFGSDVALESSLSELHDSPSFSPKTALKLIDHVWYTERNKRGRRMDLIGDYAGSERFILDGEALFQNILDDRLLAIGRAQEASYQILHAKRSLEYILEQLISRSAVFDVVFFGETRHLTLKTGSSPFVVASRALARRQLFNHLRDVGVTVYTFSDLRDKAWFDFRLHHKPMFIMTNDGGSPNENEQSETEAILCQRVFLFDIMSQALPVVLLKGAEFRDSKIISFVFEQGLVVNPRRQLPEKFWKSYNIAYRHLESEELRVFLGKSIQPLAYPSQQMSLFEDFYPPLLKSDVVNSEPTLLWIFLAHCILLPSLSMQDRTRKYEPNNSDLQQLLLDSFLPRVFVALEVFLAKVNLDVDIDGILFNLLLRYLLLHPDVKPEDIVGTKISSSLGGLSLKADFNDLASRFPPPSPTAVGETKHATLRLLSFQHELFDEYLSLINLPVEEPPLESSFGEMEFGQETLFDDRFHWHNHNRQILPKHFGGEDPKPKDPFQLRKMLKRNQRFMARLNRDAGTLTGALGARFDRITITPSRSQPLTKEKPLAMRIKAAQQPKTKKGKEPFVSSKQKLLNDIKKEKGSDEDKDNQAWWLRQLEELAKLGSEGRLDLLQRLQRNSRTEKGWLSVEIRLCRLHYVLSDWASRVTDQDTEAVRDEYTVKIMRLVKDLSESRDLTPAANEKLSSVLTALGFETYTVETSSLADDRKLNFEFIKLIRSKTKKPVHKFMRITEDPVRWQLRLFGEFMDRSMGSKPDSRVAFNPDAWQRDVLDCLDRNESVLIVAPTSAGKTFISFYAMEKVLRESDDGMLVYVAPTKALVSQVAAEIYARFSKDLKNGTCWAVHTRDYRINDPQKCQILVTVPEMLSIMMLSPPLARTWLPRIKRIVMDEIHTIGQQEGGAVWEQILLLAPCPIIGLSATIGEPEAFNNWLETVQKAHGFKHTFIHHPHRYSHLRKFYYLLQKKKDENGEKVFEGLKQYSSTNRMKFLHPMTMLSFASRSMPQDLSLEARDTMLLYDSLKTLSGLSPSVMEHLEPSKFFASNRLLRQEDILRYESALKEVVSMLASTPGQDGSLKLLTDKLSNPEIMRLSDIELNSLPDKGTFRSELINLLSDLHAQGDLPALLFNFDRTACENLAFEILKQLEEGEEHWRSNSPEWERKLRAYHEWQAKAKQRVKQMERLAKQKPDEDAPVAEAPESSWEASFDPAEPDPQFSFAGTTTYSKADLDKEIQDLRRWTSTDLRALKALKRGIGVHHAGMNKAYRSLVESLFRQGYLRVVIATGTLALGINAPTKTSVFCGDSPYLTALMYRQCAGRAGRRGYDLLGKVVFYGLAFDRVQRLVLSRLPSLGGNFPLTSTLVLRLLNLIEGSDSAPVAVKAVKSLLTLPQIVWGSQEGEHQFLHHLRFSIDYLRRAHLLDYQGKPMNLFGIASHLYYTEPSNLALVALLRAGVLRDICNNQSTITAKEQFMLLMCHLFGRRYLPRGYTTDENLKAIVLTSASKVVLPRLDKKARKVLLAHEENILRIFEAYALTFASQNSDRLGQDNVLPLSKKTYRGSPSDGSLFRRHLEETSIPVLARSPFVANSGHADHFNSVSELVRTTRNGIYLNEYAIPTMAGITAVPDEAGEVFELNAYIYDFWMHGQVSTLARDNGIRRGDVWYLLQDFELSLMTIRGVIEQLLLRVAAEESDSLTSPDEGGEIDSGYGASDPAEVEEGDGEEDGEKSGFKRPSGVGDKDWRVYEVVDEALTEFHAKFKAMWA